MHMTGLLAAGVRTALAEIVPHAKAIENRQVRHEADRLLKSLPEEEVLLPNRKLAAWFPLGDGLREHLERTRRGRLTRESHNLFRAGYDADTHAQFRHVIQSWMEGRSEYSRQLAEYYSWVLDRSPDELSNSNSYWMQPRRDFLARFFSREPELEKKFRAWIEERIAQRPS
jgi:hypothetical protein